MRSGQGLLICFIGIDGTGKTTLARMLTEEMNKSDIESKYVRGRFETFKLLMPFILGIKKIALLCMKTRNSIEEVRTKKKLFGNRVLAKAWEIAVLFDYLLQISIKIRLPLMVGKSIFCDRYVYDTVVDLAVDLNYFEQRVQNLLDRLLRLVPKPNIVFLLDLPEEEAYKRNLAKNDGIPLSYIAERRKLYLELAKRSEVLPLNATGTIDELKGEILKILNQKLWSKHI